MKKLMFLLLVVLFMAGIAYSQQAVYFDVGTARLLGIGSASIAVTDDVSAAIWNPAIIGAITETQTSFTTAAKAKDAKLYMLSFIAPSRGPSEFAGALSYWNGRRDDTREEETDIVYTVSQKLGEGFYLGGNIRSKRADIAGTGDNAWAVDIGLINQVSPQLTIGLSYLNVTSPSLQLPGGASPLLPIKPTMNIGFALRPNEATLLAIDLFNITREKGNFPTDKVQIRGGIERKLNDYLTVRFGWLHKNATLGLGIKYNMIKIDYGWLIARHERADLHLISLSSSF
ncbi:hypothetical protein H5T88_06925 [bacterium]|nr:hypothetical protein [bacterium]